MFVVTSRLFYDEWTGLGGAGVPYLNALQGDKITCVVEGYFYWAVTSQKFIFDSATKTITIFYSPVTGLGQTKGFVNAGFNVDDLIEVVGTTLNDGTYTVASVTDGVITVVETLVDETANSANVYGITLITEMDYFYNLISNTSDDNNYISLTDKETIQVYSATGLDASVTTPVYMTIGSKSKGWVTDIMTGDDSEAYVEGVSNADYKQSFKITQVFYMTRIWTKELAQNFANRKPPIEYTKGGHLKHICQIDGKFNPYDPLIVHTGSLTIQNGQSGWFDQTGVQKLPEYSVASIQYQNYATSEYLTELDGSIVNLVTMVVNSRSGNFLAGASQFILNHFLCPLAEADYVNTETTLLQNIRLDKKMITMDDVAVNGIEFGTDYQSLTNIQATYVSATQVLITFRVDYSTATKTILANKSVDDRYYSFVVSCQDVNISTTRNIDRVNCIADFNNSDYDLRNDAIFGLVDYIHCFAYPNYGVFEVNNVTGYQGDPSYIEIPFWVETAVVNEVSPTIQKINVQIVATKTDNDDFIIEEKSFDVSFVRKLDDKQTIDEETSRGFIFADDNPFNRCDVVRYEDGDSGTMIAYKLRYAFALRYEEWIEVVQASTGASYDIFKDITDVVQTWKQYNTGFGWALKFRMNAEVEGYDGFVTKFQTDADFVILEEGDAPQDGETLKGVVKYFNLDGIEVEGIIADEPTRIVARFNCDTTVFPTGMTAFNGFIAVDDEFGSIFTRRIASLDFDSESDSPFSVEDLPALQGYVSQTEATNLRLTEYADKFVLDTIYTPIEPATNVNYLTLARISYQQANIILQETGSAILQEDNSFILLE